MDSHIASNYEGYYLINESNIVLHIILESRNDVGVKVVNKTIEVKINEDKTITIIDTDGFKKTFKKYFNTVDEHDISK